MKFVNMRKVYPTITPRAAALYEALEGLAEASRRNGYRDKWGVFVFASRDTLAKMLGCHIQTARKAVRELIALGLITERRVGQGSNNRIYMSPPKPSNTPTEKRSICMMRKAAPAPGQMTLEAVEPSQNTLHPEQITPSSAEIVQEGSASPCNTPPAPRRVRALDCEKNTPIVTQTTTRNVPNNDSIRLSTRTNGITNSAEDSRTVDRHGKNTQQATENGENAEITTPKNVEPRRKTCRTTSNHVEKQPCWRTPEPPVSRDEYRQAIPAAQVLDHDQELDQAEADELTGLLDIAIDAAITTRPTHKIFGAEVPALDVRRAFTRLDVNILRSVQTAINDQVAQGTRIRNVRAYAVTALYAAVQCRGLTY